MSSPAPSSPAPLNRLAAFLSRHRFFIALMTAAACEQGVITVARVATSYRAIEFNVSVVLIGIITASYALAPIFLAVKAGRYVDLGFDARIARVGTAIMALSCAGLALSTHWTMLLAFNSLLGVAHMCLYIGLQVMCARDDRPGALERTFGNFMVANAVGQALGSGFISYLGGSASIAPAQALFVFSGVIAAVSFVATLFLTPMPKVAAHAAEAPKTSVTAILKVPGFVALFLVSVISVLSQDLLVVYLPLIGVERNIGVDDIGAMLALRAATSMTARLVFARLNQLIGGNALLAISTLAGAAGFIALALPIPIWAMYLAIAVSGFALGIAITVAIAASMAVMTPDTRGTATSLRMVGNRIAQFAIPFLLSLVAAATSAGGIFGVLGAGLVVSAAASHLRRPAPR